MEVLFFTGTLIATSINHILWNTLPSAEQLEREAYWAKQIRLWKIQRDQDQKYL
jgi:hypothetical protein